MRVCVVGSGAVGGYFGAKLSRAGHDVVFIARGAHLHALLTQGLTIRDHKGEWRVAAVAQDHVGGLGDVDLVLFAVKSYSNPDALLLLGPAAGPHGLVLTVQNGVDSPAAIGEAIGRSRVIGGAAYVAAALMEPGVIEVTGAHRRIAFGETYGDLTRVSTRSLLLDTVFSEADIQSEPFANGWIPLWEKYIYLAPFAAFTGASRQPIGPLWSDPETRALMIDAFKEVQSVADAEHVPVRRGTVKRVVEYIDSLHPTVRSSLLIDLQTGKPTEVESLVGGVVRRAKRRRIKTPVMNTLYAALRPRPPVSSPAPQPDPPRPAYAGFPR